MSKLRSVAFLMASLAVTAMPVSAGVIYDWSWTNECGGNNFSTCSSGAVAYSADGKTITVTYANLGPGDVTALGLFGLPSGTTASIGTPFGAQWATKNNAINGGGLPGANDQRVAARAKNGGFTGMAPNTGDKVFTFKFASDMRAYYQTIGVGTHVQRGPRGCSTKFGVLLGTAVDNASAYDGEDCGTSVPEPGSMALLASGAVGMAFLARRRRNGVDLLDEDGNDVEV